MPEKAGARRVSGVVGFPLPVRSPRGVRPTPAGCRLSPPPEFAGAAGAAVAAEVVVRPQTREVRADMDIAPLRITYIGGPTALIEIGPLRLLTDPTFDPAGTEYPTPAYTLVKSQPPAVPAEAVGRIDAVLLSHDHHFDNLDHAGRAVLAGAGRVLTTA